MKLKKIASLMLAGVMAVSMLAGCNSAPVDDNTDDNNGNVVTPTSIVTAVNDGQSATNRVKIDFTADAALDSALTKAVKSIGDRWDSTGLNVELVRLTGNDLIDNQMFYTGDTNTNFGTTVNPNNDPWKNIDGTVIEGMAAMPLMNVMSDKAAAEKAAAKIINEVVAELDDTTYVEGTNGTVAGEKYCDFSYTGTVSMVSSVENDGTVNYYFAFVITQTTAVKTLKV